MPAFRAVVLESGLVSDLSWPRWYLDSDLSLTWSSDLPNVQVGLDRVQQYMLYSYIQSLPVPRIEPESLTIRP